MKISNISHFFIGFSVLSAVYLSPATAADQKVYEGELCYGCDASNAAIFAKKYAPKLTCYDGGGQFDQNDGQQCYSTAQAVVIFNGTTKQKWLFNVSHSIQGQAASIASDSISVSPLPLPQDLNTLTGDIIDYYDAWDRATKAVSDYYSSPTVQATLNHSQTHVEMASGNFCENEAVTHALNAAFDPRIRTAIQEQTESQLIKEFGSLNNAYTARRLTSLKFTVGITSIDENGTVEYLPDTRTVNMDFYDPANGHHRVVYNVDLSQGIDIRLNEDMTKFAGIKLGNMKRATAPIEGVPACLIEKMNSYYPATVTGSNSSGMTISLPADYNRSPGVSLGGGRCKWTFYNRAGEAMFSYMGSCP
ncbi:hypothetical protein ACFOEE_01010 [Pseudoalteromonas fenneropenaei]|uniref:Uncharacterized protein n=1 Tax=Pseudoalteromonas fenneropenaei TaxID=1737459 RepID=A0ABV7CCJ8_9GAMM